MATRMNETRPDLDRTETTETKAGSAMPWIIGLVVAALVIFWALSNGSRNNFNGQPAGNGNLTAPSPGVTPGTGATGGLDTAPSTPSPATHR